MSATIQDMFPDLYFDVKQVEEKTPKKEKPSVGQVIARVLVDNGMQNSSLTAALATAVEAYYQDKEAS
jgi:hypothetical protein